MADVRKAWFIGKQTGLGMRPASWQGWLLFVALFVWIAGGLAAFLRGLPADNRFLAFAVWLALAAGLLFLMRSRTTPAR